MPTALDRRMRIYAFLAVAHLLFALIVSSGVVAGGATTVVLLVAAIPLLLAAGHFQAALSLNPWLSEAERVRWRIALFCFPWSMALYWHRYARG